MDKNKVLDWLQEVSILATRYKSINESEELHTMGYFDGMVHADRTKPHIHIPNNVFENIVKVLDVSVTMDNFGDSFDLYFELYDCYFFSYYKERIKDGKDK